MKPVQIQDCCIDPQASLNEAITCIDFNARGIALVVDSDRHLLGTITDGDVRRAMLAGMDLYTPVSKLLEQKVDSPYPEPVTAPVGTDRVPLLSIMQERQVFQLPLVDNTRRVVDLVTLEELLPDKGLSLQAVVMAGGYGSRLQPLTEDLPKPMLPVGDRPLMELIINRLRHAGIRRVSVTTHYMSEKIVEHFGDGSEFGMELNYVSEDRPLGTAGALGLMETPKEPLLVINGDILTGIDFRAMLNYHKEQKADMTVAMSRYEMQVPYGVIECDGPKVRSLREKPLEHCFVNAGIYLLEPVVHQYIPEARHFDMTDLINRLLQERRKVVGFPIREYWLDIGHHDDYEQALEDTKNGRLSI